ncbi:hypothetical protein CYMTET_22640 [Cymbomonas tetramitiformis]|uniref:Uncharacterized protein n=1 Tax=Cymbomonas tetramitiformis TaxID=36881 RepID=A0AAE0KU56_9CHLO|nr:hypothetical protein CYMTET_30478 [Cymbomonas tetramitiformis]KAK3268885.1 hypothetical protein CYMTET_22640 [Cymbomonas tetramitiformis]
MGETFEPFSQEGCNAREMLDKHARKPTGEYAQQLLGRELLRSHAKVPPSVAQTTLAAPPASSMPQSLVTLPEDSHQPKCARQLATRRKTRPAGRPAAQPAAGQETQRPRHANVTFSITCVSPLAPPARPMPPPPLRSAYQDLRSEHYSEGSSDSDTGDDGSQFQQRAADLERQQVVQQTRPAGRPAAQPAAGQETQRPRHANVTFSITCVSPLAPPARPMPPPPLRSAYQDLRSVHYSEGSSDSDTRDSWDYLLWSPSVLSDPEDSSDLDD